MSLVVHFICMLAINLGFEGKKVKVLPSFMLSLCMLSRANICGVTCIFILPMLRDCVLPYLLIYVISIKIETRITICAICWIKEQQEARILVFLPWFRRNHPHREAITYNGRPYWDGKMNMTSGLAYIFIPPLRRGPMVATEG